MAFVTYNDRSPATVSQYTLMYGRIDYAARRIDSIPIVNHVGTNSYNGAMFLHNNRFYYWGSTVNLVTTANHPFPQRVGFINLIDKQEVWSCYSGAQNFDNFASGTQTTLDVVSTTLMNWISTGYTSGGATL